MRDVHLILVYSLVWWCWRADHGVVSHYGTAGLAALSKRQGKALCRRLSAGSSSDQGWDTCPESYQGTIRLQLAIINHHADGQARFCDGYVRDTAYEYKADVDPEE